MTARPPEEPDRGYPDYGDSSAPTAQYGYGQYGEQAQRGQPGQYGRPPDPYAAPVGQYPDPAGQYPDPAGPYADPAGQYPDPAGQPLNQTLVTAQLEGPPGPYDPAAQYGDAGLPEAPRSGRGRNRRGRKAADGGRAARSRQGGASASGFVLSLLDFDFTSFVTPRIVKNVYVLAAMAVGLSAIAFIFGAFTVSVPLGVVTLLLLAPVYFVLGLAFWRVMLEFFMVVFRLAEDIHDIRERGAGPR